MSKPLAETKEGQTRTLSMVSGSRSNTKAAAGRRTQGTKPGDREHSHDKIPVEGSVMSSARKSMKPANQRRSKSTPSEQHTRCRSAAQAGCASALGRTAQVQVIRTAVFSVGLPQPVVPVAAVKHGARSINRASTESSEFIGKLAHIRRSMSFPLGMFTILLWLTSFLCRPFICILPRVSTITRPVIRPIQCTTASATELARIATRHSLSNGVR